METVISTTTFQYASVWVRFVAWLIDLVILFIPGAILNSRLPIAGPSLIGLLYFPFFHASVLQATPGKKAMGIKVTDVEGNRLSLPMAFGRYLIATLSLALCMLGHLIAFFTPKKQAVHDLICNSVVIRGTDNEISIWEAWASEWRRLFGIGKPETKTSQRLDELERLHEMKKNGAISEEEYQRLKKELLD